MLSSRNVVKACLAVFCWLVALPAIALADGVPFDPQILIDLGGDAFSVATINQHLQPGQPGNVTCPGTFSGQCFDFMNDTGSIITSFSITTMVNANLSAQDAASFTCAQGLGHEYFLGCAVNYKSSGLLTYVFSGVKPADEDEGVLLTPYCIAHPGACDTEAGEMEGIPLGGNFLFGLGGYVVGAQGAGGGMLFDQLPGGLPTFSTTVNTPEPSMIPILAGGVFLIAFFARKFRSRALAS